MNDELRDFVERAQRAQVAVDSIIDPNFRPARSSRRRKPKEPPSALPWHCVVLAVDTARRSGWSLRIAGLQREFGEADTLDANALAYIVRWATQVAEGVHLPLVLVLEKPWGGSVDMIVALGRSQERWLCAWRQAEQPRKRVVLVQPSTWRSPVLGKQFVRPGVVREVVREQEQLVAECIGGEPVRGDEAAAICIGRWAAHAAAVGKVIGKRARDASQRRWQGARV